MVGIRWAKKMKITKARLLQIIREEVELHEKYVEENVLELDEETLEELSKEEARAAIEDEIKADKKVGNLEEVGQATEDRIIKPGNGVLKPKTKPKNDI